MLQHVSRAIDNGLKNADKNADQTSTILILGSEALLTSANAFSSSKRTVTRIFDVSRKPSGVRPSISSCRKIVGMLE